MTIDEICSRFNISRRTFRYWKREGIIPPAYGTTRNAWYGQAHIQAIQAHLYLKHTHVVIKDAVALCKEEGISLPEFVEKRKQALIDFPMGVA